MNKLVQNTHGRAGNLFLLSAEGQLLCVTAVPPPYDPKKVIGQYAWAPLKPPDDALCQAAILRCCATGKRQVIDVHVNDLGLWRCWYFPCKTGKARIIGCSSAVPEAVQKLTKRELEICAMLATGLSGKQVAAKLDVRRTTIDNHKRNIAQKLGIATNALVAWSAANRDWL
jgi:DNA-binding CsgD family transcriptional regulator